MYIKAGSRNDTLETSGTSNLLARMLLKGSTGATKGQLAEEVESMGARIGVETDREITSLNLTCFKGDLSRAVSMLGDCVSNATLDSAELEMAKQEQARINDASNRDLETATIEACHYNAYRDHMMGQPIRGDPDNLQNLSSDMLQAFRAANYTGENIVIVGTGAVDHDAFVDQVSEAFGALQQSTDEAQVNSDACIYTPALLMMRDDEMYNANVGVFFDAPSVNHQDFYQFQLLKHMIGDFEIQKHAEHLNDVGKQYNATHSLLGDLPDVTRQACHYFAYSDCGIWGSYLFGNEIFVRQMNWVGLAAPVHYGEYVTEVEVVRARNAYWNSLMKEQNAESLNAEIGRQILQTGRRVPRSEVAKRISWADADSIRQLSYQYFYDSEPSFTNWGPIQDTSSIGSYKYFKLNTMTTVTNLHHSLST